MQCRPRTGACRADNQVETSMKKILSVLSLCTAVASSNALAQQPVVLKLASFEPATAPITGGVLVPWAEAVSRASGGTLKIEIFPGGTLGRNPLQQLKLVQDGVADITWTVPGYTPGRFDDTEVAELPFLVNTALEGSLAMTRLHQKGMLAGFDDLKLLLIGTVPANNLHARTPVRTLADLKGKRVRAGSSQIAKLVEHIGAVPVQIGAPQVADSLAKGVIDASLNEWNFVSTFKIDQVVPHHLVLPMGTVAVMVPMLKSKFDALPPQAREALEKYSGEALARRFGEVVDRTNDATRERVAASGKNTVTVPDAGEREAWRKEVAAVSEAWRNARPRNQELYRAFSTEIENVRAGR
jgi:TRAP-type C4-dicarboxylate transport system substrate-binding protein